MSFLLCLRPSLHLHKSCKTHMSVPHLPLPCKVPTPSPMLQAFPTSLHSQLALTAIAQTMHLVSWPRPRPVPNLPPYSPFSSASTPLYTYHHHHLSRAIKEEPITFLQKKKRQHLAFKRAKINTKKRERKKTTWRSPAGIP